MAEEPSFAESLRDRVLMSMDQNRERVWEKGLADMEALLATMDDALKGVTKRCVGVKYARFDQPGNAKNLRYFRVTLWNYAQDSKILDLFDFAVRKDANYPVETTRGIGFGKETLQLILLMLFSDPASDVVQRLREIHDHLRED